MDSFARIFASVAFAFIALIILSAPSALLASCSDSAPGPRWAAKSFGGDVLFGWPERGAYGAFPDGSRNGWKHWAR